MDQDELLRSVVRILERLDLRYLVTGSVATIFYGEPRFTIDIDIVVDLPAGKIRDFVRAFPEDEFYLSAEAVRDAVARRGQFDIIHPASGLKVDVMIPSMGPFDRSRFQRARTVHPAADYQAVFASPEDVILKKLEYFREGGAQKHLQDIAGILKIADPEIDRDYIASWVDELGVGEEWNRVLRSLPG